MAKDSRSKAAAVRRVPKLEVRPKVRHDVVLLGLGCGAFTVGGLGMIFTGVEVLGGLICVVFFGGGGLYAISKFLRRGVSMVLSSKGIQQRYPQGNAFIPWADVEKIGIVSMFFNKMVGIRLRSYDRYLSDMSPELAAYFVKSLPYVKLLARATSVMDVPAPVSLWSKLEGIDISEALRTLGKVGTLAEALMWARAHYGYDVVLSWADLDRSAEKFVAMLGDYRVVR